jgi:hypothetical protein
MSKKSISPDIISKVDVNAERGSHKDLIPGALPSEIEQLRNDLSQIQAELAATQAENEIQNLKMNPAYIKARMMQPYADKTFIFVCLYCAVTTVLICLSAALPGFAIPDGVQMVIAGSTAVAAIGLVSIVVSGLFRSGGGSD